MKIYVNALIILGVCCLLVAGCQDYECDPPSDRRFAENDLTAIPFTDGQQVTYDVSDGSNFIVRFNGGFVPAVDGNGCREQFLMDFAGSNGAHTINGEVNAFPTSTGLADVSVIFYFNQPLVSGLSIERLDDGRITAGRNPNAVVLDEITLNGNTYRDVLEETFDNTFAGQIKRAYYNIEAGIIGVEFVDGVTFFRR